MRISHPPSKALLHTQWQDEGQERTGRKHTEKASEGLQTQERGHSEIIIPRELGDRKTDTSCSLSHAGPTLKILQMSVCVWVWGWGWRVSVCVCQTWNRKETTRLRGGVFFFFFWGRGNNRNMSHGSRKGPTGVGRTRQRSLGTGRDREEVHRANLVH